MWSAYILSILAFSCSAQYLFAGGWIFLDLWVSSSALLLDCMCFFDFMFPFQVTAFDIWLVRLLSPQAEWWQPQIVEKKFLIGIGSTHYLFRWDWIVLDLWVSSSDLLLDCICFFDFMFPFKVTAFDIWLVMLLPPLRPVVATTLLKSYCHLELGWYFRHFVSNSFTIQSIHSLLYWKVQHSPKFRIKYHVLK